MVGAGGVDVDVDLEVEVEGKWRWKDTLDSLVFLADERDLERGEETSSSLYLWAWRCSGECSCSIYFYFTNEYGVNCKSTYRLTQLVDSSVIMWAACLSVCEFELLGGCVSCL